MGIKEKLRELKKPRITMDRAVHQTMRRFANPPYYATQNDYYNLSAAAADIFGNFRGSPAKKLTRLTNETITTPSVVAHSEVTEVEGAHWDGFYKQLAVDVITVETKIRYPHLIDEEDFRRRMYEDGIRHNQ